MKSEKFNIRWIPWAKRRRWCAWGGVLALMIQLIIPLSGQAMPLGMHMGGSIYDEASTSREVCDFISGNPADNNPDPSNPFSSCLVCPLCQLRILGQDLILTQSVTAPMPIAVAFSWRWPPDMVSASAHTITGKHSRAPPFAV